MTSTFSLSSASARIDFNAYLDALQGHAEAAADHVAAFQPSCSVVETCVDQNDVDRLDQILDKLSQTVSALQQIVFQVQTVRDVASRKAFNQHALVNSLPVEIMIMIFRIVVGARRLSFVYPYVALPDPRNITSLRLTHVCHYWRDIAQQQSLLWNTIIVEERTSSDDAPSSLQLHAIRLAADAPLHVFIDSSATVCSDFVAELAARAGQLRSLYVYDINDSYQGYVTQLMGAPRLETFSVLGPGSRHWPLAILDKLSLPLKHLRLDYYNDLRSNNSPTNLTRLTLTKQLFTRSADWIHGLLTLLERNPSLCEIHMSECYPLIALEDEDLPEITITRLPKLTHLYWYRCDAEVVSAILERLELPDDGLHVEIFDWLPHDATVQTLIPTQLLSRWRRMKQPFTTLDITFEDFAVTAATRTSVFTFQYPQGYGRETIIADVRHLFPFAPITTLYLWGYCHDDLSWTIDVWRSIFGEMTSLTNLMLALQEENTEIWLDSLLTDQLDGRPCPVPNLHVLRVAAPVQGEEQVLLLDVVTDRDSTGHRLQTLHIVSDAKYGGYDSEEQMRDGLDDWLLEVRPFVDEVKFEIMTRGYVLEPPVPPYDNLYPMSESS